MIASRIVAGLFAFLVTASLATLPSLSRGFKGIVWNVYWVFVVEPAPPDDSPAVRVQPVDQVKLPAARDPAIK